MPISWRKKRTYILTSFFLLVCIGAFAFQHPIFIKMIAGTARIIPSQLDANVFIDGSPSVKSKVFYEKTRCDGTPAKRLIIWLHDQIIFTLDLDTKEIGLPNASNGAYDMIFGKLIQADSGDSVVFLTDGKAWPKHDPALEITPNTIEFTLPEFGYFPEKVKLKMPDNKTFPFG